MTAALGLPSSVRALAPIRVLVVDDSAVVRQLFTRELGRDPQIEVVATASDAYFARDRIVSLHPDVMTLDINMPRMDGITFLQQLMKIHPMPVIVISSLTTGGGPLAIDAMAAGAIDVMAKPGPTEDRELLFQTLIEKIKNIPKTQIRYLNDADTPPVAVQPLAARPTRDLIMAMGASTGGVQALVEVLSVLPADAPGTLVVQHMPSGFTASFAERLNKICLMRVKEAADGDKVVRGQVLVAPGGMHMVLRRTGTRNYYVELNHAPEVEHQRPSVNVLFDSVAQYAGGNAIGAILTGMGADGSRGLLRMRQAGAKTIAQDEASSVVFGMPAEAIKCHAAQAVVALNKIAAALMEMAQQPQ